MPETFDVAGARKAGYSDEDIARHLGKEHGFDTDGALKAGYQPAELIKEMGTRGERGGFSGFMDSVKEFASATGSGLVNVVKGPADVLRSVMFDEKTGSQSNAAQMLKGTAERNVQNLHEAKDAWHRGDYSAAAVHAFNYLVPFGSALDEMANDAQSGHMARSLGNATAFGVSMAAPGSPVVRAAVKEIPNLPLLPKILNPNPVEAAAVDYGRANGINVPAGVATGNTFVKGAEALADHSPIGSVIAHRAKAAEGDAFARVGGELADQAHPNAIAPAQAGRDVTSSIENTISQHHAEANAQYNTLREIEADPANLRNVQIGTKQIPHVDAKTGQQIPGQFDTVPDMQDVALPVDLRKVKESLRPVYNQITRQMPISQQRASTGLKALENIINGPDAAPASQVDMDLGTIKAAARGADLPELKTLSQGLAARAVEDLHIAVSEAVGRAERTGTPNPATLTATDEYGDTVSQPAIAPKKPAAPATASTAYRSTKSPSDLSLNDQGILYTTANEEYSKNFGTHTQKLEISPRKTLDLTHFKADAEVSAQDLADHLKAAGVKVSDGLMSKLESGDGAEMLQHFGQYARKTLVDAIKDAGYDSARINEYVADTGKSAVSTLLFDSDLARPAAAAPAARSAATEIRIPGTDRIYPAEYEFVERKSLQGSHNAQTFEPNPKYGLLNDRNYNDPMNRGKVIDAGGPRFQPAEVANDAPSATTGPPIADRQGNLVAGNGRNMMIERAYDADPGGGFGLKDHNVAIAEQFGSTADKVRAMKEPVLVRRVSDETFAKPGMSKRDAISDMNVSGTAALTPAEQSIVDSRRVSQSTLDHVAEQLDAKGKDATLAQVLEGHAGVDIYRKLKADGVIPPNQDAALTTENALTDAGKKRIQSLMTGRFFRDASQIDNTAAAVKGKIERIAAPAAATEREGAYNLTPHIRGAVDLLDAQRAHGSTTLDDYLDQSSLFVRDRYTPESIELARQLQSTNPNALTDAVRTYAAEAKAAGDYQGAGMFGDIPEPPTPRQAFNKAFQTTLKEEAAPAAQPPAAIPAKPAGFDEAFKPTAAPAKPTAPPLGAKVGKTAGQEALDALAAGRRATAAKYDAAGVLKSLPKSGEEGRQVFDSAIWAKDAGIEHLREIQRLAPAEIPKIARAYLDELFGKATAEGGFKNGASLQASWQRLGPETKEVLYPNPIMRRDLDNFFLLAKKAGERVNPSGTATTAASMSALGYAFLHPVSGVPMIIGTGALSALLHSPAAVEALSRGLSVNVSNAAAATIAANRILRLAGSAAQPATSGPAPARGQNVIPFPAPSPSLQTPALGRAVNQ